MLFGGMFVMLSSLLCVSFGIFNFRLRRTTSPTRHLCALKPRSSHRSPLLIRLKRKKQLSDDRFVGDTLDTLNLQRIYWVIQQTSEGRRDFSAWVANDAFILARE
jgi:hypothetical protein